MGPANPQSNPYWLNIIADLRKEIVGLKKMRHIEELQRVSVSESEKWKEEIVE